MCKKKERSGFVGLVGWWVAVPEKFWRNAVKMHNSLSHQRLLQCNHFVFMQPQLKSQCRENAERLEVASRPVETIDFPFFFLSLRVKTRRVDQGNGFKELELEDEAEA